MRHDTNRIAIYSRKSKFTGKGESIGNQVELCKEYVRNMFGPEYADLCVVFEDEGFSGGNLKRPAFQRMMEDVRSHRFKAIVVYRLDRISRNISDFTGLIDELTKLDVAFVSIREQFDTSTPMGRAMMFIISVFSQLERETIAERIRDNMHELAKTGRWLGGNTPTGYTSESVTSITLDGKARKACKLKLIPEEAELVRIIFDLYIEKDSLTAVEAELLRRRIKTRKGNDFTRFSIKGILENPVYMIADAEAREYFYNKDVCLCSEQDAFDGEHGMMVYNRTAQEKGKTMIFLPMAEWIVAVGSHPGIIPAKQWIRVQESLERNKSKAYRKPRNNAALLTGLLYCACGDRMYPKLTTRKNSAGAPIYTYVCKRKERSKKACCDRPNVSGNVLDGAILAQIKCLTGNMQTFAAQIEKSKQFCTGNREQRDMQLMNLRAELEENERVMDGLVDSLAILSASSAKLQVAKRIEKWTEINRKIENRIRELEWLIASNALSEAEFDKLRKVMVDFCQMIDGMGLEEKRAAVRMVVQKVVWDGINAHLVFCGADESTVKFPGVMNRMVGTDTDTVLEKNPWGEDSK